MEGSVGGVGRKVGKNGTDLAASFPEREVTVVRGSQLPGRPKTGQANHERLQTAAGEGIMDRMESNTFFAQAIVPYFV